MLGEQCLLFFIASVGSLLPVNVILAVLNFF